MFIIVNIIRFRVSVRMGCVRWKNLCLGMC